MGWNFCKSIKVGPARVNLSKSGVGYSIGAGGIRYTKKARKAKKSDGGRLVACVKGMFWLFIAAVVVYFVSTYWKWLLALAAVAVVAAIGYWIWIKRQTNPKQMKSEQENKDPVP